jgi:hypothetical protein
VGWLEADDKVPRGSHRGLVSVHLVRQPCRPSATGFHSLVIHNFYNFALPWTDASKDVWWHMFIRRREA